MFFIFFLFCFYLSFLFLSLSDIHVIIAHDNFLSLFYQKSQLKFYIFALQKPQPLIIINPDELEKYPAIIIIVFCYSLMQKKD